MVGPAMSKCERENKLRRSSRNISVAPQRETSLMCCRRGPTSDFARLLSNRTRRRDPHWAQTHTNNGIPVQGGRMVDPAMSKCKRENKFRRSSRNISVAPQRETSRMCCRRGPTSDFARLLSNRIRRRDPHWAQTQTNNGIPVQGGSLRPSCQNSMANRVPAMR